MQHLPKITIVTPVYNGAKYIEKTITSVLDQNYPNLEYIIMDGGSTDGTVDIIKKYESKLTHWQSSKDAGLYDAIQKGFDMSTGEIMAWINSDDYYSPHCFSVVAEIFEKFSEIEWLTGLSVVYDEKDRFFWGAPSRSFTRLDLLRGDFKYIQQESTFWCRSLWQKAGSTLGKYKLANDFELWLRFSRYAKLYCCDAYLGGFRERSANQLSLDKLPEYLAECDDAISLEPKTSEEVKLIRAVNFFKLVEKLLIKTKIFNRNIPNKIIGKICKKYSPAPRIKFDRLKQDFYM